MLKKIAFILMCFYAPTATVAGSIKAIILQTSLNQKDSKSDILAEMLHKKAKEKGLDIEKVSLKDFPLPLCNGHEGSAYDDPQVRILHDKIKQASIIFVAFPIYNYSVSAATKNLLELTSHKHKDILSGDAWKNKVVGLVGVAGSPGSLMASLTFAQTLILDDKCHIVPEFVFASWDDFDKTNTPSPEISDRLTTLLASALKQGEALKTETK